MEGLCFSKHSTAMNLNERLKELRRIAEKEEERKNDDMMRRGSYKLSVQNMNSFTEDEQFIFLKKNDRNML